MWRRLTLWLEVGVAPARAPMGMYIRLVITTTVVSLWPALVASVVLVAQTIRVAQESG